MTVSEKTAVFDLSCALSRRYTRRKILSMRKAYNLNDYDLKDKSVVLSPGESFPDTSFSNFLNVEANRMLFF